MSDFFGRMRLSAGLEVGKTLTPESRQLAPDELEDPKRPLAEPSLEVLVESSWPGEEPARRARAEVARERPRAIELLEEPSSLTRMSAANQAVPAAESAPASWPRALNCERSVEVRTRPLLEQGEQGPAPQADGEARTAAPVPLEGLAPSSRANEGVRLVPRQAEPLAKTEARARVEGPGKILDSMERRPQAGPSEELAAHELERGDALEGVKQEPPSVKSSDAAAKPRARMGLARAESEPLREQEARQELSDVESLAAKDAISKTKSQRLRHEQLLEAVSRWTSMPVEQDADARAATVAQAPMEAREPAPSPLPEQGSRNWQLRIGSIQVKVMGAAEPGKLGGSSALSANQAQEQRRQAVLERLSKPSRLAQHFP